jgi:hypothetical protein
VPHRARLWNRWRGQREGEAEPDGEIGMRSRSSRQRVHYIAEFKFWVSRREMVEGETKHGHGPASKEIDEMDWLFLHMPRSWRAIPFLPLFIRLGFDLHSVPFWVWSAHLYWEF